MFEGNGTHNYKLVAGILVEDFFYFLDEGIVKFSGRNKNPSFAFEDVAFKIDVFANFIF